MRDRLQNMLKNGVENFLFSGAGVGIYSAKKNHTIEAYEGTVHPGSKESVFKETIFDLASLTKAMVTSLLIMDLVQEGLSLETPLSEFYGDRIKIGGETTLSDLLLHQSGLVDHRCFYEKCSAHCGDFIISEIMGEEPVYGRGEKQIYSDLGFILLGDLIEQYSGKKLARLWKERVAAPLGIENELYYGPGSEHLHKSCAYTTSLVDNSVSYCGKVHDDNCRVMGGIAGHAGLFGTIKGSLKLYISLLNCYLGKGELPFTNQTVLQQFWKKPPQSRWAFGFDTPSTLFSTTGKYFSKETVGHLGFTGTSFWIDPVQEIVVAVFTNRAVYADNLRAMKQFRPRLHDAIMEGVKGI